MHMNTNQIELLATVMAEEAVRVQQARALKAYCAALLIVEERTGDDRADRSVSLGTLIDIVGSGYVHTLYFADRLGILPRSGDRFYVRPLKEMSLQMFGAPATLGASHAPGGISLKH